MYIKDHISIAYIRLLFSDLTNLIKSQHQHQAPDTHFEHIREGRVKLECVVD